MRSGPNLLFAVWLVSRAATDHIDRAISASGLTADEFGVYSLMNAGPLTPTELSERMAAPPTTVSSYVRRFEGRGHVRREPNPDDRRSYRVGLTPAGRRAHRRAGELFLPLLEAVEAQLGQRTGTVERSLLALRSALDEAEAALADGEG